LRNDRDPLLGANGIGDHVEASKRVPADSVLRAVRRQWPLPSLVLLASVLLSDVLSLPAWETKERTRGHQDVVSLRPLVK
jgi:hypothetical protein